VTQLLPHYAPAYCQLGRLEEDQEHFEEAVRLYSTALRANPDHAESHYRLGLLSLRKGHASEASLHFREALRIEPDNLEARKRLDEASHLQHQR